MAAVGVDDGRGGLTLGLVGASVVVSRENPAERCAYALLTTDEQPARIKTMLVIERSAIEIAELFHSRSRSGSAEVKQRARGFQIHLNNAGRTGAACVRHCSAEVRGFVDQRSAWALRGSAPEFAGNILLTKTPAWLRCRRMGRGSWPTRLTRAPNRADVASASVTRAG